MLVTLLLATGCGQGAEPNSSEDQRNVVSIKTDDPELVKTIQEARVKLPMFVAEFKKPGERLFFVKSPFPTDDGGVEHMWSYVKSYEKDVFTGMLTSEPLKIKSLRVGSLVCVKEADVEDWMIESPDGTRQGAFSEKVVGK